ncbi:MAG: hypothetical protein FWF31_09990 [Desulfobulbus sp.]|nr:hypothetical protein [Desulfobulbus sp.]
MCLLGTGGIDSEELESFDLQRGRPGGQHDLGLGIEPGVNEPYVTLRGYQGCVRQLIPRGNGREQPAFLITNDFASPLEAVVGNYARRWRVENGIAEAVKLFRLNSMSSPILTKVHFDVALTMVADTLYAMLARKLRGFEDCDAPKIYRNFISGNSQCRRIDCRRFLPSTGSQPYSPRCSMGKPSETAACA